MLACYLTYSHRAVQSVAARLPWLTTTGRSRPAT